MPPHDGAELEVSLQGVFAIGQWHGVKACWQRPALRHFSGQSDQVILAVAVQARQRPDHVADIGADAEFRHATDVDGDFHE